MHVCTANGPETQRWGGWNVGREYTCGGGIQECCWGNEIDVGKVKGTVHPRTGHDDPDGEQRYSCTLSLTSALDGGWVVNATPRPPYPREGPDTHCIGGWVSLRAGLDGYGKISPPTGIRSPHEIDVGENIIQYNIVHLGQLRSYLNKKVAAPGLDNRDLPTIQGAKYFSRNFCDLYLKISFSTYLTADK